MEAVPRLHMLWFALKSSPEGTSFANLKKYIAEFYQEDPEAYSKDVLALQTLRNQSMHPGNDSNGCKALKRYYCQLHSLLNRFPQLQENPGIFTFKWKDLYQSSVSEYSDMRYELAAVLFNIAALHTQVGASVTRGDVDGMKLACTHFQCAAWAFGELRERYTSINSGGDFMTTELLVFMQQVSFAQAQECILEKSLIDNRKPNIVAKVTAQIVVYYGAALTALLTGGDYGPIAQVADESVYKLWKKYVHFKISYLSCILYLYQGQHAEEQQKMGERVTLYQAAWDKLEEARKESKGLPDQKEINESLVFTADVVEAKRKNAKNENEFIYHESVPELSDISAVQGANLVNGISFSVTDPEVAGEDIFARLVPMQAHEASSMYSEEKAKLLRKYCSSIEEKDAELATFMSSLTLDNLNISEEKANKIPQGIVDRCAALNANTSAIPDLISVMSQLAEICSDVELNLKEIANILAAEESQEREFETATGVKRTPNAHITELTREFQKYSEAHARAGESNDTLRKAMELHVNNLKILARPLQEIQQSTPKLSTELNTTEVFRDVKLILNKVNEMKAQRSQFHADLRIAVNADDITSKVIAHGSQEGLQMLFDRELSKHERLTQLIDQNLLAQQNILQALTEAYAKAAPALKTLADVKHKRDSFFSSLAASYDVYEDLLAKSTKGLEFYKKLAGNVQKLLTRFKAARDVQSEERQQRLRNVNKNQNIPERASADSRESLKVTSAPKLRDYLQAKKANSTTADLSAVSGAGNTYIPLIRPNPLGSENPTQATCISSNPTAHAVAIAPQPNISNAPNEPPPPYSLQQPQFYDPKAAGYTNPMYQQQQQNMAPPAYSVQASPNSQFINNSNEISNMTLQQTQKQQIDCNNLSASQHNLSVGNMFNQNYGNFAGVQQNILQSAPANSYPLQTAPNFASVSSNANNQVQALQSFTQPTIGARGTQSNIPIQYSNPVNQYPNMYSMNPANISLQQQQQQQQRPSLPQPPQLQPNYVTGISAVTIAPTQPLYVTTANDTIRREPNLVAGPTLCTTTIESTVAANEFPAFTHYNAMTKHPGYSYNSLTGMYDYDSGYQVAASNSQFYGQYTSPWITQMAQQSGNGNNSHTTDSENASKLNISTGLDKPVISHAKPAAVTAATETAPNSKDDVRYYNTPYGYHSTGINMPIPQFSTYIPHDTVIPTQSPAGLPTLPPTAQRLEQHSTYMQSGRSQPITHTTKSVQYTQSPQSSPAGSTVSANASSPPPAKQHKQILETKKSANMDLLTDIDFSGPGISAPSCMLPEPALKPQVVANSPSSRNETTSTSAAGGKPNEEDLKQEKLSHSDAAAVSTPLKLAQEATVSSTLHQQLSPQISTSDLRKTSYDNISISSDLSSLDQSFDWDSVSVHCEKPPNASTNITSILDQHFTFIMKPFDPFVDDKILKYFHKEVERFEKTVESLNVKMLNGNTPLSSKWKDLQDMLAKNSTKRTTTIARLFPEKNRSIDCLPYDHARVMLEKVNDNYINAAFIKNLGPGCPHFIIAQTPQQNTVNDFWSMIWSQKARTVLCLHTPNEMLDPFWPQTVEDEMHIDDFCLKVVKINSLSHCSEFNLRLSMHGADAIIDLSLLQIKAWIKSSPNHVIGIAHNVLQGHQQRCLEFNTPSSPLVMNCLTGSDRSGLISIAICAILATQAKRPLLINVVDVWSRICAQRQNALRDTETLEQSMQIVLNHAHDVLNKRGIITSYQMKTAPQVTSKEKEDTKDPLNELDPLWKLKQK